MGERALGFEVVEEESQQPLKPLILGLEVISGIWVGLWASSDLGMCEHWAWMFGECFLGSFFHFLVRVKEVQGQLGMQNPWTHMGKVIEGSVSG